MNNKFGNNSKLLSDELTVVRGKFNGMCCLLTQLFWRDETVAVSLDWCVCCTVYGTIEHIRFKQIYCGE